MPITRDELKKELEKLKAEFDAKIELLEDRIQCSEHEKRISAMEGKVQVAVELIEKYVKKLEAFIKGEREETTKQNKSIANLKWWCLLFIMFSLIFGTFIQDKRFSGLDSRLNTHESRIKLFIAEQELKEEYKEKLKDAKNKKRETIH